MPSLSDFMFGQKEQMQKLPTMDPQQMQLLQQLLGGLGGTMGSGMDYLQGILSGKPEAFSAFEAPFKRQFQESTIPGLAERFSGMGSGSQGSSAFSQQLGAAGAGLSENLASMREGLKQNALSQLMGMTQTGLGAQPFAYQHTPGTTGFMGAMAPGLGMGLGSLMGGGMGIAGKAGMGGLESLLNMFKGFGGSGGGANPTNTGMTGGWNQFSPQNWLGRH